MTDSWVCTGGLAQYGATIRDGRDDDSGSGGGVKKTVAIVAHRRGICPSDESREETFNPLRWL